MLLMSSSVLERNVKQILSGLNVQQTSLQLPIPKQLTILRYITTYSTILQPLMLEQKMNHR